MSLETNDPTVAVVIERVDRLREDLAADRVETHRQISDLRKLIEAGHDRMSQTHGEITDRVDAHEKSIDAFHTSIRTLQGLAVLLAGLVSWASGFVEKIIVKLGA